MPLVAQRQVAKLLNCRKCTTIIEALNANTLTVALPMYLSNPASPVLVLLITQSIRSCQRGTGIRHTHITEDSDPLDRAQMEGRYHDNEFMFLKE
jgi:hypothetical protein